MCIKVLKYQEIQTKTFVGKMLSRIIFKYSSYVVPVQLKTKFKQMVFGRALNSKSKEQLLYPSSHTQSNSPQRELEEGVADLRFWQISPFPQVGLLFELLYALKNKRCHKLISQCYNTTQS